MRCILIVLTLALAGCTSTPTRPVAETPVSAPKEGSVTVLYQSNRNGWLEPCGCHSKPYGGIDREANAVAAARATNRPVLYVDAGNAFAAATETTLPEARRKRLAARAERLAGALDTLGLDAVCPGPGDLALGLPELQSIALRSKFAWVSSNLMTRAGAPVFSPYVVLEKGGIRYALLGLTAELSPALAAQDDLVVAKPADALNRWLPEALSRADVVVLLSQLEANAAEKLVAAYPQVKILIGADKEYAFDRPVFLNGGQTLLLDPMVNGFLLGRLDVDFKLPFVGFYSPEVAKQTRQRLERLEASNQAAPSEGNQRAIERLRKREQMEVYLPTSSKYSGELIQLSVENYGKPNAMTKWLKDEKKRIQKEGRASATK